MDIRSYIKTNWDKTIRYKPQDEGTLMGLPYPYTVPSCEGHFQEMFYWDTYFTNAGLIYEGRQDQAKNNIDNICYLVETYGFMPNGNHTFFLTRSQPPFLSLMVRDLYDNQPDDAWLAKCYQALEKEYEFWQTKRITSSGLNRYFGTISQEEELDYCRGLCNRFQIPVPEDEEAQRSLGKSMLTFAESGWDCTSRMGMDAYRYNWVDLNALLYGLEQNMAYFADILKNGRAAYWQEQAAARAEKMTALMWDDVLGAFCDYNFETGEKAGIVSTAMFYPLFTGLATAEQAEKTVALLAKLEMPHGIASCEGKEDLFDLQWDYPNGWACLHYIVIHGLMRYGYREDALRIARKYVKLAGDIFQRTGHLWEKYNVVTGEVSTAKEYATHEMMGWSAGVYLDCLTILENA